MSRALLRALAAMLVVVMFGQIHMVQAFDGMTTMPRPSVSVDMLLAYVDPGAAGFIIVSVLGFISAAGYILRSYIGRLKRLILGGGRGRGQDESEGGIE